MYTGNILAKFHGNILSLNENIAKSFRVGGATFFDSHCTYTCMFKSYSFLCDFFLSCCLLIILSSRPVCIIFLYHFHSVYSILQDPLSVHVFVAYFKIMGCTDFSSSLL